MPEHLFTHEIRALGTRFEIKATLCDRTAFTGLCEQIEMELERIEAKFSRFRPDSQLSQVNTRLGQWQRVDTEFVYLIDFGEEMRLASGGAFDLTVHDLLVAWGYDRDYHLSPQEVSAALGKIYWNEEGALNISAPLDFGGLGKGYALDRCVELAKDFPHLLINAGGDIFTSGLGPDDQPWKLVFEHPTDLEMAIGEVQYGTALFYASSSPQRRHWGTDRHHLVDPIKHQPARQMLAVYTQGESGIKADAWSTALFSMGFSRASDVLQSSNRPVEALLVGPQGEIFRSERFRGQLYNESHL